MEKAVEAREGTLSLPTYAIKGENRNPVFRSQYGVAHIYPYTLLDDIDSDCADKTYHTLVLENRYLRVTILTELGGRVYSVFDKISGREVFYKNSVVRFAPLAIRGAFFSGGVEFSFPVAHAPTTASRVNWDLRQNEDGSASAFMGGLEHLSGLRWMITLTLFPDRCALAQDVYLFNPGTLPGRYHYWTNASLDASDKTEFIYPFHRVRSYEYAGSASWPFARLDLIQDEPGLPGMEGVPMWPVRQLQTPINFRWQKNMLAQVSIFGREVSWDYFGAWQHAVNHGFAHVARSRDVSGMKLWSWGNAPVGVINQTALTDDGSQYAETQCGAMETQLDFDFLLPGQTRTWREWWLPLRGIGGLTCASEALGVRLHLSAEKNDASLKLTLAVCPAKPYASAVVTVSLPDRTLVEETCSFSPEAPWIHETMIQAAEIADKPMTLTIRDSQGNLLLENTRDREPDPIDLFETKEGAPPSPADDCFVQGLRQEKLDNREEAQAAYREALQASEDHPAAHLRLGLLLLRSAALKDADLHLGRAEELGLIESSYYRGRIAVLEGRLDAAEEYFKAARTSESHSNAAQIELGKIALRRRNWDQAIGAFEQADRQAPGTVAAAAWLAVALRCAGQTDAAHTELRRVLGRDPLHHLALYEMASGSFSESREAQARLQRILSDDEQYFIDLACYYVDAGLLNDALKILEMARGQRTNAMTAYLGAFLSNQNGDVSAEAVWFEKARRASPDFVFPSRLEEVQALQFALENDLDDSKAKYFLGNFLYAYGRYEEAIRLWTESLGHLESYDVLLRNLGLAAWQRKKDPAEAIRWFEKALSLNPHNQDLYLHLDELYAALGLSDERARLLDRIGGLVDVREDIRKHRIKMMVELGHYQEALDLMTSKRFIPLEMDQSFHEVYVRALMLRAKDHLDAGRIEEAIQDYYRMLEYPQNHGVGAPITRAQAHIYYQLGAAYEKLGKYREAIKAWREAASEHHPHGKGLFAYVQKSLDKLSRYSELGLEG